MVFTSNDSWGERPGTGTTPDTATLRAFKRTGDAQKMIVVRRGSDVAVFQVGTESQSIRTPGLFVPIEPDTVRGSPSLVRALKLVEKVHLCRGMTCTEEGGEHFHEYAVVKKFVPERFQLAQAQKGAVETTRRFWSWVSPPASAAVSCAVQRVRDYASESETEEQLCAGHTITWKTAEGLQTLAESRCKCVGAKFHQILVEDLPAQVETVELCPKHATQYLTKRYIHKCGNVDCNRVGTNLQTGVRLCTDHAPARGREVPEGSSSSRRSRSRSRVRTRSGDEGLPRDDEGAEEAEDEDEENGEARARDLLRGAREGEGDRRQKRRVASRSPGHTPKSNLQRNLAKINMLNSPGSEMAEKPLEMFMERFAEGRVEGIKEEQIRLQMSRDLLLTDSELRRKLIEEAEIEQNKGQRGLSRFLTKWKREAAMEGSGHSSQPVSDWSLISEGRRHVAEENSLPAVPPVPASFQATPVEVREEPGPPRTTAENLKPSPTQNLGELRVAPPGLYRHDRKAGATTTTPGTPGEPMEQIAKALQNQTAELASLVKFQAEGSGSQPAGTLKGLGRQSEELVFLLRACGQYDVKIGEGEHGQALANGLLAAQVGSSTKLRAAGFRQKMTQRLAIGLAGPYWGAHEKHGLSAADFVSYTDAELDQFASEARNPKNATEQRPPQPSRLDEWLARVRRQTDVWCLVYGAEWKTVRTSAVELLAEWHLAWPHRWPLNVIMDLWEEIHWHFFEELKDLLRRLKRDVGRETMTLNELKFHALLPGPDGQAWLVMPTTFDIERPDSWFQTEVMPRIERKQERLLWNMTWQGNQRRPTAPGPSTAAGGEVEKPTLKGLWGPKLSPEEVNKAKERAPLDRNGQLLCWGNLCHIGCSSTNCQRSHDGLRGSFEGLDPNVQMQLLKRGGLKRMKAETKESVAAKIKEIRAKVEKDKGDKIQDGRRRSGARPNPEEEKPKEEPETGSKAGGAPVKAVRFWEPPTEFYVDYTEKEDVKGLVVGPSEEWGNTAHQPTLQRPDCQGHGAPQVAHDLVQEAQRLGQNPALKNLEAASDDLYAWAAARVAREPEVTFMGLMTEMATYGLGDLAKEAAELIEATEGTKAGSSRIVVKDVQWQGGQPGGGNVEIDGQLWTQHDYKEEIYMTEELAGILRCPEPVKERKQCVMLALGASVAWHRNGRQPSIAEAQQEAQQIRLEQARLAAEARGQMGDPPEYVTAVEHEARIYIHDILHQDHEKDFRSLAVFPVQVLQEARVVVIRADFRGGLIAESVVGAHWEPGGWTIWMLIWKGHMTVLQPPSDFNAEAFLDQEETGATPALGFTFYWHSRHDQPVTAPGQLHCRLCKGARKAGESPPACRPHSCLASVATVAGSEAPHQVYRELRAVPDAPASGLVLQELFAGTGRITHGWQAGGKALTPVEVFEDPHARKGYRAQDDLLLLDNQQRVLADVKQGRANVWWIAAPCTTYCDWQLQNGGTRTFAKPEGTGEGSYGQREQDGNALSTFAAEVFVTALESGSFPVCESSAASGRYPKQWDLPCWQAILQRDDVDYIEFPMCAFGLGPPDTPNEFYLHRTRVVFPRHAPLRQVLLRHCPGVGPRHKHVALKGCREGHQVTRCTEAGAYAWEFIHAVVAVLQSSLVGGGWFSPQKTQEQGTKAGGKRAATNESEEISRSVRGRVPDEGDRVNPEEGVNAQNERQNEGSQPRDDPEESETYTYTEVTVTPEQVAEELEETEAEEHEETEELGRIDERGEHEQGEEEGPLSPSKTPTSPASSCEWLVQRALFAHYDRVAGHLLRDYPPGAEFDDGQEEAEEEEPVHDPLARTMEVSWEVDSNDEVHRNNPEDYWEPLARRDGRFMRVHDGWRRRLFVPHEMGVPFPLENLRNERRTIIRNRAGVGVVIDDNWRDVGTADPGYGQWRGFTIFTLQGEYTEQELWYAPNEDDDEENPGGDDDEEATNPGTPSNRDHGDGDSSGDGSQVEATWAGGAAEGGTGGGAEEGTRTFKAPSKQAKEAAEEYVEEVANNFENTEKGWSELIVKGNNLVTAAGSVKGAAESLWEVREDRGLMNLKGVDEVCLDRTLHPDLLAYLRHVRKYGMPARYVGPRDRVKAKMHPNARRNVNQVYKQVAKDVKKHRALVVDGSHVGLGGTVSSPLEAVDKMLPDRTISPDKRVVHDQRTVNTGTSKYWHPPALQPTHVQIARRILWMKTRCPGLPVLMAKKDIAGAFRLLWVSPEDVALFGTDLPWQPDAAFQAASELPRPVSEDVTVIYLVSSFGFSGSPGEWTMWGRATEEFHRAHRPADPRRDLSIGYDSKVLVDDCVLVEPWVGLRPWTSAEVFEKGVRLMLGDQAVNVEKDEIEGTFQTAQTVWGVIMETDTEKAVLPERRIQKGAVLLTEEGFDHGSKNLTLKQLQQFRGIMTGWSAILPSLKNELKAADKFLVGTDGGAKIRVNFKAKGMDHEPGRKKELGMTYGIFSKHAGG